MPSQHTKLAFIVPQVGPVRAGRVYHNLGCPWAKVAINDETLVALERQALVQAESGADILGPSDMMDGRIKKIRVALEEKGFKDTMIMSYAKLIIPVDLLD